MIKVLLFDVFGTVVDWRRSIIREGERFERAYGIQVDWEAFADDWRDGYAPAMAVVRRGERPFEKIDILHREILDGLLAKYGITDLSEQQKSEINHVWHRLDPWPDAIGGLLRLKSRFICATLSNGNMALLVNMAKRAGLPWDCVLSAELERQYKPELQVYRYALAVLDVQPEEAVMVAAHHADLHAAASIGMRTAFVHRPDEGGPGRPMDGPDLSFDFNATDFHDLADQLV